MKSSQSFSFPASKHILTLFMLQEMKVQQKKRCYTNPLFGRRRPPATGVVFIDEERLENISFSLC